MSWLIAGITAAAQAGAAIDKNKRQDSMQDKTAQIRAEEIRTSPWTGVSPQTQIQYSQASPMNVLGGAVGGLAQGAGLAKGLAGSAAEAGTDEAIKNIGANQMQKMGGAVAGAAPAAGGTSPWSFMNFASQMPGMDPASSGYDQSPEMQKRLNGYNRGF